MYKKGKWKRTQHYYSDKIDFVVDVGKALQLQREKQWRTFFDIHRNFFSFSLKLTRKKRKRIMIKEKSGADVR